MLKRVDQDIGQSREQKTSDLIAAGLRPGTEAFEREMTRLDQRRNDAANQAYLSAGEESSRAFNMQSQARKDYIAELLSQRQTPLNEVIALMSGSQVSNPFAGGLGYQGGANVAPAPIFGAATAQGGADMNAYNAGVSSSNATTSGLASLAGAATMFF